MNTSNGSLNTYKTNNNSIFSNFGNLGIQNTINTSTKQFNNLSPSYKWIIMLFAIIGVVSVMYLLYSYIYAFINFVSNYAGLGVCTQWLIILFVLLACIGLIYLVISYTWLMIPFAIIGIIALIYLLYQYYFGNGKYIGGPIFIPNVNNESTHAYMYQDSSGRTWQYIPDKDAPQTVPNQYTYSIWMYVSSEFNTYRNGQWKHVLSRGSPVNENNKVSYQNPGLWLAPNENRIYFAISVYNTTLNTSPNCDNNNNNNSGIGQQTEGFYLDDIPLDKWFNVTITLNDTVAEIYKNCKLEKTLTLYHHPASRTQQNIYVTQNGGYLGKIAYLQYINKALGPNDICKLYQENVKVFDEAQKQIVNDGLQGYTTPKIITSSGDNTISQPIYSSSQQKSNNNRRCANS